jgi:hypothetical protein
LELDLTTNCITIFKPFYRYNCTISETTFVNIPKTTFSN